MNYSQPAIKLVMGLTAAFFAAAPVMAQDIVAMAPTTAIGDPTIRQASDYIIQTNKAHELRNRRREVKPGVDSRVVKEKRDNDRVLILGGSEVIPM